MVLTHPIAPEHGSKVVAASLTHLNRGRSLRHTRFGCRPAKTVAHVQPHWVYSVNLSDLIKGRFLTAANKIRWRYLLVADGEVVGSVELTARKGMVGNAGDGLVFHAFREGPYTEGTVRAIAAAEKLRPIGRANYQIRYLRVPALYFAALWLHRKGQDILIPIVSPPKGLVALQPFSEAQVLRVLQPLARRVMEMHTQLKEERARNQPPVPSARGRHE